MLAIPEHVKTVRSLNNCKLLGVRNWNLKSHQIILFIENLGVAFCVFEIVECDAVVNTLAFSNLQIEGTSDSQQCTLIAVYAIKGP